MIHVRYEDGDIAEKYKIRVYVSFKFFAVIVTFITGISYQKQYFIVYINFTSFFKITHYS